MEKPAVTLASITTIAPTEDGTAILLDFKDQKGESHKALFPIETMPEILRRLAEAAEGAGGGQR